MWTGKIRKMRRSGAKIMAKNKANKDNKKDNKGRNNINKKDNQLKPTSFVTENILNKTDDKYKSNTAILSLFHSIKKNFSFFYY